MIIFCDSSENHREIAAFEEENLALRRELQEARASKKQTSKCVNDELAAAYGDINFESLFNSPCITSTPVRTTTTTITNTKTTDPSPKTSIVVVEDFRHEYPRCTSTSPASSLDSSLMILPLQQNDDDTIVLDSDDDKMSNSSSNNRRSINRPGSVDSNKDSYSAKNTSSSNVPTTTTSNFSRTTYTAYI